MRIIEGYAAKWKCQVETHSEERNPNTECPLISAQGTGKPSIKPPQGTTQPESLEKLVKDAEPAYGSKPGSKEQQPTNKTPEQNKWATADRIWEAYRERELVRWRQANRERVNMGHCKVSFNGQHLGMPCVLHGISPDTLPPSQPPGSIPPSLLIFSDSENILVVSKSSASHAAWFSGVVVLLFDCTRICSYPRLVNRDTRSPSPRFLMQKLHKGCTKPGNGRRCKDRKGQGDNFVNTGIFFHITGMYF